MKSVDIPEGDLEVTTMRSGGAGGQHVNKTESAVRVKHLPTGLAVRCDAQRSQLMNKVNHWVIKRGSPLTEMTPINCMLATMHRVQSRLLIWMLSVS